MRILLTAGIYRPEIGGPATYVPALADKLMFDGHQVELVTLRDSRADAQSEAWNMNYIIRDQNLLIRFFKTFVKILSLTKYSDAVFANGLFQETGMALLLKPRMSLAKVVSDPVWERATNRLETSLSVTDFNKSKLRIKHRFQRIMLRFTLNRFDYITCPSSQLKEIIESWGVSKNVVHIPNGVAQVDIKYLEKKYDLVTVCRLIKLKNLEQMITASKATNSSLAIVGSGPEEIALRNFAELQKAKVDFLGELQSHQVIETLLLSKIYINLSSHEGLSFAILEAMACGLPAIVSNIAGNTEVILNGYNGIIVQAQSLDQVNSAIKLLKNSETLRSQYGDAALAIMKSKYNQITQLNKVIELLLHGND
jgi:glycosyltransferase involved in cell wall biosynthesis